MLSMPSSCTPDDVNWNTTGNSISQQPPQRSPTFDREKSNLESHQLIWLDANINGMEYTDSKGITIKDLRKIVDYTKLFDKLEDCEEYLNDTTSSCSTFLVFSGQLEQTVVEMFSKNKNIYKIYIYCQNAGHHQESALDSRKIGHRIYADLSSLITALQGDVDSYLQHNKGGIFGELDGVGYTMDDWVASGWGCFRNLLIFLPYPENYHLRLTNELKSYYAGKEADLLVIEKFERDYTPQRAIWWYTRPTFFFYTLNHAFRHHNIRLLLLFGFWIRDLYRELNNEYHKYKMEQLQLHPILKVYRGQVMSCEEREGLENREPFVNSSPFSTSLERQVASFFLESCEISDELDHILFEIEVDLRDESFPFADISHQSSFSSEAEILFMAGASFEYTEDDINRDENGNWIVKLRLMHNFETKDSRDFNCNTHRSTLKRCINELITDFTHSLDNVNVVFDELMSIYPAEERWISAIKFYCAGSCTRLMRSPSYYQLTLPYYKKAYEIWMHYLNDDDLNSYIDAAHTLVACAVNTEDVSACEQYLCRAIHFYVQGIKRKRTENVYELIQHLDSLVRTYEMKIKIMQGDDSNEKLRDASRAIKWQKLHIQLMLKYPHSLGIMTIEFYVTRVANIYELIGKYDDALTVYQEVLDILLEEEGIDASAIAHIYERIASIYTCQKNDLNRALQYELIRHNYVLEADASQTRDAKYQEYNKKKRIIKSHSLVVDACIKVCDYGLAIQHLNAILQQQLKLKQMKEQERDMRDSDLGLWNAFNSQCIEHQSDIAATEEQMKFVRSLLA